LLFSHCYIYNNEFYCDSKIIDKSIALVISKENFEFIRKDKNDDVYFRINNIVYKNNTPILKIDMNSFVNMAKNKFNITENFIANLHPEIIFNEYVLIGISPYTYSTEKTIVDGYKNTVVGRDSKGEWGYREPISYHTTMETNVNINIYYISISTGKIQNRTIFSFDFKDCPWFCYSVTRLLLKTGNNKKNELINSREPKNSINNMKLNHKEFVPTLNINSTENFECSIYKINMLFFEIIRAKINNISKNIFYSKKIKEYKIFHIKNSKYILLNEFVPYYSNGMNLRIYRYIENVQRKAM
jgi:hypothetical protein